MLTEDIKKAIEDGIEEGIKKALSGYNDVHTRDMQRIIPIIEAYETNERRIEDAKRAGKTVLWLAGAIITIGSAYLMLKTVFFKI